MSDPATYTVGWICAIPTEAVAARQFLDEEHDPPSHVSQNDNNVYTLGRIGQHRTVIAVLPKGEYGTTSAANVARDMLHSFPNVRIGLMVGIGGGAPSKKHDIRLGDVVISSPRDGRGGVLQYDYGKAIQGQGFQNSGFLNQPPILLRAAVGDLEGRYSSDGNQIHEDIQSILAIKKRMKRSFQRPELSTDRLYLSSFIHTDNSKSCDEICNGDEGFEVDQSERLVKRNERRDDEDSPAVHYGLIASANTLMKDAEIRDSIAETHGVLCFEMEAAGLMNHFPCLAIRGICDYSDTHKNKEWQGYAAMTAAAYTKVLLGRIPPTRVESERKLSEILSEKLDNMQVTAQDTNVVVKDIHEKGHQQRIDSWLSPSDPSTNYKKALEQRHRGSGQWFLAREAYSDWKTKRNSFLWLHGIPGCGKTVLSSTIIEDLQKNAACLPLYFYFDFNDTSKQILENAVRSLITQLYGKRKDVQRHVDSLYSSCENGRRQPSIDSLCKAFQDMIQRAGEVWIILDALDECETRSTRELLSWIESIRSSEQTNVHILATSRQVQEIQSAIEKWASKQEIIPIQSDLVAEDIHAYVKARVRKHDGLSRWKSRPDVQDEIEYTLTQKAHGMFRWVSCQLDALEDCLDYSDLSEALVSLPETLYETYARILRNIPTNHKDKATRLLQILTFSKRPLRIDEALDAIAVKTGDKPNFNPKNRMPVPEEILKCCSSLVVLVTVEDQRREEARKEIQLAHFSVKEYLVLGRLKEDATKEPEETIVRAPVSKDFEEPVARAAIAEVCLVYLSEVKPTLPAKEIRRQFFLAQYSARYWASHAIGAESHSKTVRTLASQLFLHGSSYKTWFCLYDPDQTWNDDPHEDRKLAPPLYYASLLGLISPVIALLDNGADVNAQGGRYGNALQAASSRGHERVVQKLLDNGADINAQGGDYGNALQAASEGGHREVVQMLLDKGADVNAQGGHYGNALQAASFRGHGEVAQMLLDKGADVNAQGGRYGNALQAASEGGHREVVQKLFEKGADVNAQGGRYGNALQAASEGGHREVVQMLLDKGANTSAVMVSGTALAKKAVKRSVSPTIISGDHDERAANKPKAD